MWASLLTAGSANSPTLFLLAWLLLLVGLFGALEDVFVKLPKTLTGLKTKWQNWKEKSATYSKPTGANALPTIPAIPATSKYDRQARRRRRWFTFYRYFRDHYKFSAGQARHYARMVVDKYAG